MPNECVAYIIGLQGALLPKKAKFALLCEWINGLNFLLLGLLHRLIDSIHNAEWYSNVQLI